MAKRPRRSSKTKTTATRSATRATARKKRRVLTRTYDVAEELRTPAEMAEYMNAWLEMAPDDARGLALALRDVARAYGMSKIAKEAGLSRERLFHALSEDQPLRVRTVAGIAKAVSKRFRLARA